MKYLLPMVVLAVFTVFGVYLSLALIGVKEAKSKNAETTLRVVKQKCGSCHQSTLPTAKEKALEAFDLDKTPWFATVSDKTLKGISSRIGKSSDLSELEIKPQRSL